ncbi:MAG: hypothetical protein V1846_05535 [Candidatus Komeilibacteria bacterium]
MARRKNPIIAGNCVGIEDRTGHVFVYDPSKPEEKLLLPDGRRFIPTHLARKRGPLVFRLMAEVMATSRGLAVSGVGLRQDADVFFCQLIKLKRRLRRKKKVAA